MTKKQKIQLLIRKINKLSKEAYICDGWDQGAIDALMDLERTVKKVKKK